MIDNYIQSLDSGGILQDVIKTALDDYHVHGDYIPIKTWDEVVGYRAKPEEIDGDDIDRILSVGVVEKFIKAHGITVHATKKTANHCIYYVDCINSDAHTTTSDSHTDSFISVSLNGMINFRCNHAHCDGIHWKDYKNYYLERDGATTEEPSKQFDIKLVQGCELQKQELPPIVYPVENLIPQGYTVASAPFKYGKSWFALEMCLAIAEGSPFLGQKTTQGAAVYFALEDSDVFAQERLNMVLGGKEAPKDFYYIYESVPTLDDGLLAYLNQLHGMLGNLKIVVIDILAMVEYQARRGETAYKCDYRTGSALKTWADDHNISILVITHTTKMIHPNDVFMNTTGTSGVSGSADALITIAKESRSDKKAVLAVTGRRIREKYYQVHLADGYIWTNDGEIDPNAMEHDAMQQEREQRMKEYKTSEIRTAVIKIANAGIDKEISSRDIIEVARDQDIYLTASPKEIGGFICKYQNYLYVEDQIKVYIHNRGTGSNMYKFETWEKDNGDPTPWDSG